MTKGKWMPLVEETERTLANGWPTSPRDRARLIALTTAVCELTQELKRKDAS